jgi:hypothetical protein
VDVTPLVGVRPEVIAEAEHAFGNLFHRLRYCVRKLATEGVESASVLDATIGELEDVLRLLLDYTSPLAIELRAVEASAVLGSLAAAVAATVALPDVGLTPARHLNVDPGRLSAAFQLMGYCLGGAGGREIRSGIEEDESGAWLVVEGVESPGNGIATGRAVLAWAVAQKMVEAQGGLLFADPHTAGLRWSLRLPLVGEA